jgi:hypothetical protein
MITALDPRLLEALTDTWLAALRYRAAGHAPEDLRGQAADPRLTEVLAREAGVTGEQQQEKMLAIADRMTQLAAEGLTPVQCWYLGGLDQWLGPYPGTPGVTA